MIQRASQNIFKRREPEQGDIVKTLEKNPNFGIVTEVVDLTVVDKQNKTKLERGVKVDKCGEVPLGFQYLIDYFLEPYRVIFNDSLPNNINCSTCVDYGNITGNQKCLGCNDYDKHRN